MKVDFRFQSDKFGRRPKSKFLIFVMVDEKCRKFSVMCSLRRQGDFLKVDFRFQSDKFGRRPMSKFLIFVLQKGLGQGQPH